MTFRSCAPATKLALEQGHHFEPSLGNYGQSFRNLGELFQGERKFLFHGATSFPGLHPKVIVGHSPFQQKHIVTLSYFSCQQAIYCFLMSTMPGLLIKHTITVSYSVPPFRSIIPQRKKAPAAN